jgi:predicted DNA-binding transcriptional regulator AlpA
MTRILTIPQVAERLGVSSSTFSSGWCPAAPFPSQCQVRE